MLFRKFASRIEAFLRDEPHKILLINGARQIGKSFLIRYVCKGMFRNYIELNLKEDKEGVGLLADVRNTDDFYIQISIFPTRFIGFSPLFQNHVLQNVPRARSRHGK